MQVDNLWKFFLFFFFYFGFTCLFTTFDNKFQVFFNFFNLAYYYAKQVLFIDSVKMDRFTFVQKLVCVCLCAFLSMSRESRLSGTVAYGVHPGDEPASLLRVYVWMPACSKVWECLTFSQMTICALLLKGALCTPHQRQMNYLTFTYSDTQTICYFLSDGSGLETITWILHSHPPTCQSSLWPCLVHLMVLTPTLDITVRLTS